MPIWTRAIGNLGETDRDMLGMLAGQAAVALDNARWADGLEQQVAERTAELNARVDELAILNSVGEAMAQTLDVETVTRIVGDKVRDIFQAEVATIVLLDAQTKLLHTIYTYDVGEGGYMDAYIFPLGEGLTSKVINTRKPLNLGTLQEASTRAHTSRPNLMKTAQMRLLNHGLAYPSWSAIRCWASLILAVTASMLLMKTACACCKRFRPIWVWPSKMRGSLKRNSSARPNWRIINSVQAALAAELNIQGIYDAVGDKIREIFDNADLGIRIYDPQTNLVHFVYIVRKWRTSRLRTSSKPGRIYGLCTAHARDGGH